MLLKPDPLLLSAIEHKRMIRLVYHGKNRLVEPHDHGILNGSVQLLGYQIAGSSSRPLPTWILMKVNEMEGLELLEKTFAGEGPLLPANIFSGTSSLSESKLPSEFSNPPSMVRPRRLPYSDLDWPDAYSYPFFGAFRGAVEIASGCAVIQALT